MRYEILLSRVARLSLPLGSESILPFTKKRLYWPQIDVKDVAIHDLFHHHSTKNNILGKPYGEIGSYPQYLLISLLKYKRLHLSMN